MMLQQSFSRLAEAYGFIVEQHDFLETLAAGATFFALVVQLPIFLWGQKKRRKDEAVERAFNLLEQFDRGDLAKLRSDVVQVKRKHNLSTPGILGLLSSSEVSALREFMNYYELMAIQMQKGRVDRATFRLWWNNTLIKDWEDFRPLVQELRAKGSKALFVHWEREALLYQRKPKHS
ncbi:DUF4760 domain-containing protein [Novosphingobium sp. RL4]|uniref:DUF4760 domain-containing protein n=1 Tax=Novosphingobium sp. RL4 TaxID=3109595 RepID=UPI002D76EB9C|nr:DUF4760 domain-containing protein [Novosphingobium sp. RL4]WRT91905.1 DUF4760 domain-containing protein [Novosphingobium sp. RL4]